MREILGSEPQLYKDTGWPFMLSSIEARRVLGIDDRDRKILRKYAFYADIVTTPGNHMRLMAPYIFGISSAIQNSPDQPNLSVVRHMARTPQAVDLAGQGTGYLDALLASANQGGYVHIDDISGIYHLNERSLRDWNRAHTANIERFDNEPFVALNALHGLLVRRLPAEGTPDAQLTLFNYAQ